MPQSLRSRAGALLLAACWTPLLAAAASAELDKEKLYQHIRKSFSVPKAVELELKELKPSPIPGFDAALVESRYMGRAQTQSILIAQDGRYYVMSGVFALQPSPIPGILSATDAASEGMPPIHVTSDTRHLFVGQLRDMTVDPDKVNLAKIALKNVPSRGPAKAPVVLVEYSDMQCPYCERAHTDLQKNLEPAYGKKVRWVFKHFPLTSIHPWAYNAAIASACGFKQKPEALWKMGSYFFAAQKEITPLNMREKALEAAEGAGVGGTKFQACYDNQQSRDLVEADIEEAKALGVDSTPTFFINGRKAAGYQSFEAFKGTIDEMLAEKGAD